jgi:hypothetical protein
LTNEQQPPPERDVLAALGRMLGALSEASQLWHDEVLMPHIVPAGGLAQLLAAILVDEDLHKLERVMRLLRLRLSKDVRGYWTAEERAEVDALGRELETRAQGEAAAAMPHGFGGLSMPRHFSAN